MACDPINLIFNDGQKKLKFVASDYFVPTLPPQNLSIVNVQSTSVDLDWDDHPTAESFTIYVKNTDSGIIEQTITGIILSEVEVIGLSSQTNYEFWVTAVEDNLESAESNHVTTITDAPLTAIVAPPYNLSATSGDSVIDAQVDPYPVAVDQYNWYLDGVFVGSSANGDPTFQYSSLTNGQEYLVGVSVTVNGTESSIIDYTYELYNTGGLGHKTRVIIERFGYNPGPLYYDDGVNRRTYVTWQATDDSRNQQYIFYYDHDTGQISDSFLIGDFTERPQDGFSYHVAGGLQVDSNGVFYYVYGYEHDLNVYKSTNPNDITSWTSVNNLPGICSYPNIYKDNADNFIVICRDEYNELAGFTSSDGFATFNKNTIVRYPDGGFDGMRMYATTVYADPSEGFHILLTPRDNGNFAYRDCYYLYTTDGVTWSNIEHYESGGTSGFSRNIITEGALDEALLDANYLIAEKAGLNALIESRSGTIVNGKPYITIREGDSSTTPETSKWSIYTRDAGSWVELMDITSEIDFGDGRDSSEVHHIEPVSDDEIDIYYRQADPNDSAGNQPVGDSVNNVADYIHKKTRDGGTTWDVVEYMAVGVNSIDARPIYNYYDVPAGLKKVHAWGINQGEEFSEVQTNIETPKLVTPAASVSANSHSLVLNGTSQSVNTGNTAFGANVETFTFECWFRNTNTGKATLIGTVSDFDSHIFKMHLNEDGDGANVAGKICLQVRDGTGVQRRMVSSSLFPVINSGSWNYLAFTKSAQNYKIILNDTNLILDIGGPGSDENPVTFGAFDYPLYLGAQNSRGNINNFISGGMDEVRLWTVERSTADLINNRNNELTPATDFATDFPGLYMYLRMNQGAGNSLIDQIGTTTPALVGNVSDNMWTVNTPF